MSDAEPRVAATVLLHRQRGDGAAEFFLLRRHKRASFMSSSFVFPGGVAEPTDGELRVTAARELFEEAGVLLADRALAAAEVAALRAEFAAGAPLAEVLAGAGVGLALDALAYFARWITPSAEPRRYDATFFLAELPAGQEPSFDNHETVDQVWVSPTEALARAGELRLPPPQVRSFHELVAAAREGRAGLAALAAARAAAPHPILPRLAALPLGFALLLPWDPDYATLGQGAALPIADDHPLAVGPSRFLLEDGTWKNLAAPGSTLAG